VQQLLGGRERNIEIRARRGFYPILAKKIEEKKNREEVKKRILFSSLAVQP